MKASFLLILQRGTVQLALGQHFAAMNAYNKVLELEPAHAEAPD